MDALASDDATLLDSLQRSAFGYFVQHTNPANGLVADTSRPGSHASIAVVGFALSAYPVAVERGWILRGEAVQRSLAALRFFVHSDQSGSPHATGAHGFYFHFLHMDSGTRAWRSELSLIDSTLLLAGMLTAAAYFTAPTPDETELRTLADTLYCRANWRWAQRKGASVVMGWKPESGFLRYRWQGYNEALILYVLGLGSPTHPLTADSFADWTQTYQWINLYGYDFLYAGPLFIHQFSQAWIDFRGIQDRFMRDKQSNYFENSRRATYIQRAYAVHNPRHFTGLGADCWGLSAGDGPRAPRQRIAGRRQTFYGYAARGVPYGPDDGTLSGPAALASLVFAPEIVVPAVRQLMALGGERAVLASGFNASVRTPTGGIWVSEGRFGLDQGLLVMVLENHRSGLPWQLPRGSPYIRAGLQRAGFQGGWLTPC